jgi:hypothetical protein
VLFVDANVLLDFPELRRWRLDAPDVTVVVLERVEREILGLARRQDFDGAAARRAQLALEDVRQRGAAATPRGGPRVRLLRGADASSQVDAHLAVEAAAYARREPAAAVAVVSRDRGVWELANRAGVYGVLQRGPFDNAALARAVREARAARG